MNMEYESTIQSNAADPRSSHTASDKGHNAPKAPGRYLKEKPAPSRRRKRRRRKLNPRFVILLAALLVLLVGIAVGVRSCSANKKLVGRWNLDGATVYEFHKNGKGSLVLMSGEYAFTYKIEKDMVYIDFVDDFAVDSRYTFKVDGNMLLLTGGPGDSRNEYFLTKTK